MQDRFVMERDLSKRLDEYGADGAVVVHSCWAYSVGRLGHPRALFTNKACIDHIKAVAGPKPTIRSKAGGHFRGDS